MSDVFISYAHKDKEFVHKLHQALEGSGRAPWVDWSDVPLTAKWREELFAAIESADTFTSVISPASIASKYCKEELNYAVENNKRIVPIWHRDVKDEAVPEDLAAHQYIYFREGKDDFEESFEALIILPEDLLYDIIRD